VSVVRKRMFRKMRFLLILCVFIEIVDLLEDSKVDLGYQKNHEESTEIFNIQNSREVTEMGVEATIAGPARGVFNVFQNTGAEGAFTVKRAPNAMRKSAEREMNTVKFWLEPALHN
jgi:hypothetical protein